MNRHSWKTRWGVVVAAIVLPVAVTAEDPAKSSSYAPVAISEDFSTTMARMKAAKADVEKRLSAGAEARYRRQARRHESHRV